MPQIFESRVSVQRQFEVGAIRMSVWSRDKRNSSEHNVANCKVFCLLHIFLIKDLTNSKNTL